MSVQSKVQLERHRVYTNTQAHIYVFIHRRKYTKNRIYGHENVNKNQHICIHTHMHMRSL